MNWWDLEGYVEPGTEPHPWATGDPVPGTIARVAGRRYLEGTAGVMDVLGNGVGMLADQVGLAGVAGKQMNVAATLGEMALRQVEDRVHREAAGGRRNAARLATDREVAAHPVAGAVAGMLPDLGAYAALMGTTGGAGIVAYEGMRDPQHPVQGMLRGLAYTALPLAAGRAATRLMPASRPIARLIARSAIPGLTAYGLSRDPVVGGLTALTGLVAPGAPSGLPGRGAFVKLTEADRAAFEALRPGGPRTATKIRAPRTPRTPAQERIYSVGLQAFDGTNGQQVLRKTLQRLESTDPGHKIPVTFEEQRRAAKEIVPLIQDTDTLADVARYGPERALAAPQALAVRMVLRSESDINAQLAQAVKANPGDKAAMAAFVEQTAKYERFARLAGKGGQAQGRALGIYRMALGPDPLAKLEAARRMLPVDATTEQVAEALLRLPNVTSRGLFWRAIEGFAGKKIGDGFHTIWINNLLSGLPSHTLNVGSTQAFMAWEEIAEQGALATSGALRSGVRKVADASRRAVGVAPKGPVERVYFRELFSRVRAYRDAWAESAELARQTLETGEVPSFLAQGATKVEDVMGISRAPRKGLHTLPTRALGAEDVFNKVLAYRMELAGQATRQGIEAARDGRLPPGLSRQRFEMMRRENPTRGAIESALKKADYLTYTDPLGEIGEAVMTLRNRLPGGRWVVPFYKTLVNIQKRGLERGPLAITMPSVRSALAEGGLAAEQAVVRAALGTAASATVLAGLGAYIGTLHEEGRISGGRPKDAADAKRWEDEGIEPYAVEVEGESTPRQWVQWGRIAPFGPALGLMVDWMDGYRQQRDLQGKDPLDAHAVAVIDALRKNVLFPSGLLGLFDFTRMIETPDENLEGWKTRMAGSLVPTAVRQVARELDPRVIRPTTAKEAVMAGIPGLRERLPGTAGTVTGEPQVFEPPLGGAGVSPIFRSAQSERPVFKILSMTGAKVTPAEKTIEVRIGKDERSRYEALRRLRDRGTPRQREIIDRLFGRGFAIKLDPEHYEALGTYRGEQASAEIEANAERLVSMEPDLAREEISKIYSKHQRAFRARLRDEYLLRALDELEAAR